MRGPLEHHEAMRFADGERAKQDGINQAKDGGVGADAECESEDRDRGEAGRFAEHAEGEAAIGEGRVEPTVNALLANHPQILAPSAK